MKGAALPPTTTTSNHPVVSYMQVLWASLRGGRRGGRSKPIGLVLMSQELVAGIGNIYRAEILFKVSCLLREEGWLLARVPGSPFRR